MKTLAVYTLGTLPAFEVPTNEPGYWSERLCYELSHMMYDASTMGFTMQKPEASDFTELEGALSTFLTAFKDWVASAYDRANARSLIVPVTALVPAISTGLTLAGGAAVIVPLLLRVGLQILVEVVAGQANNLLDGDSGSLGEVVEVLQQAFLRSENSESPQSLLASTIQESLPDVVGLGDVLARALLSYHVDSEQQITIESFLQRVLEEWRVEFGNDSGDYVSFMASQAVVPS